MVDTDLVFMSQDRHSRFEKVVFLNEFINRFAQSDRRSSYDPVQRARALRREILVRLGLEYFLLIFALVSMFMGAHAVLS